MLTDRLLRAPWLQGLAVAGALLLGVRAITGLPWLIWVAWAYLGRSRWPRS